MLVHREKEARRTWRDILRLVPDLQVVAEADNPPQAQNMLGSLRVDVAVVDLALPGINGIELTRELIRRQQTIAVVISGSEFGMSKLAESLQAGAKCYLPDDSPADLALAVESACRGRCHFTGQTRLALTDMFLEDYVSRLQRRGAARRLDMLTNRERDVLQRLINGKTNKEVACELDLSVHTVDTHRARILQKLNLHSLTEVTKYVLFEQEFDAGVPLDTRG